jgi:ribonucleoside-diphosphate reductase alpha chain
MWEQEDCIGYIKTAAVLAAYVDQSISTNTFYNPAHYPERKVPTTVIAKNLMLAHRWGLKTFYYSLINKAGAKQEERTPEVHYNGFYNEREVIESDDDDCLACKL